MNTDQVWESLIEESKSTPIELKTKTGLHFKFISKGRMVVVCESGIEPSCKLRN